MILASNGGAAAVISALGVFIWPFVAVLAIFVFRTPLVAAIGRVKEVDVAGAKIVLQNQADEAANAAKQAAGDPQNLPAPSTAMQTAAATATKDPAGSVLTAWKDVEDTIRATASDMGGSRSPSVPDVVQSLVAGNKLAPSMEGVAKSLESLRRVAATGANTVSPATAVSFVSAAEDLSRIIKSVT